MKLVGIQSKRTITMHGMLVLESLSLLQTLCMAYLHAYMISVAISTIVPQGVESPCYNMGSKTSVRRIAMGIHAIGLGTLGLQPYPQKVGQDPPGTHPNHRTSGGGPGALGV